MLTSTESNPNALSLREYLQKQGVLYIEDKGKEIDAEIFLRELNVLRKDETITAIDVITPEILGHNKSFGNGWYRGGGESLYKIVKVSFDSKRGEQRTISLAAKAVVSMGSDISRKIEEEVLRYSVLGKVNRAPRVFGYSDGIIYKEFLEKDSEEATDEERKSLFTDLKNLGMTPLSGSLKAIDEISILSGGRLVVIDAGSGDLSGPTHVYSPNVKA